ncbi:unnamed protein product [Trifolium pratense]|uniref:Uncharacterized protein n=1 Tax=Trifolium pratense TaxID=57577 RepID=A0ACB0JUT8_TRIPR|nr:unnamed protein product [Trifolium pratense]
MSRDEAADMVNSFLGVDRNVVMGHFAKMNGLHLKHSDVEDIYSVNHGLADKAVAEGKSAHEIKLYRDRSIRAFLLFLVCCTIFSNKSSYYVDVVYLQYFQDLSAVREWTPGMSLCEIDRVFMEELDLRMIAEEMRGQAVVSAWDHEPGYMTWFYKVSHPVMRPVQAPASPPRPPNLEVLIEAAEARNDPNMLQVCRGVRDEVERSLREGEAVEGTPVHGKSNVECLLGRSESDYLKQRHFVLAGFVCGVHHQHSMKRVQ